MLSYQICKRCVMDSSDPNIVFDEDGVCNHCHHHQMVLAKYVDFDRESADRKLAALVEEIKRRGQGKENDCIIGVSGGVDSTYVAWLTVKLGLRPLAVHVDNGWNSDIAVRNIHRFIEKLGINLYTDVFDWEQFKDLQRAFLLADVPDVEIPTDFLVWASIYKIAAKRRIPYIISGTNHQTESHLPGAWSQGHRDYGYIKAIHAQFGAKSITKLPKGSFVTFLERAIKGMNLISILDYVDYSREIALEIIQREVGWQDYGGKHHESVFTRWYQGCYLPRKFGFDKRRTHLSSLVSAGELDRDDALAQLQPPPYDEDKQDEDCLYVAKKLGFTKSEFDAIMKAPPRRFEEFDSYSKTFDGPFFQKVRAVRRAVRGRSAAAQ
jgi:N-acetyl sugar amidotransferase